METNLTIIKAGKKDFYREIKIYDFSYYLGSIRFTSCLSSEENDSKFLDFDTMLLKAVKEYYPSSLYTKELIYFNGLSDTKGKNFSNEKEKQIHFIFYPKFEDNKQIDSIVSYPQQKILFNVKLHSSINADDIPNNFFVGCDIKYFEILDIMQKRVLTF